jgi:hypothetical protein
MNILKNVINKIAESDKKTELKSEKVELGLKQDAEKLNKVYYGKTDTANSHIKKVSSEARAAISNIDQALKATNEMKSLISKLEKTAKDLGINVDALPELREMKIAVAESKDYEDYRQSLQRLI